MNISDQLQTPGTVVKVVDAGRWDVSRSGSFQREELWLLKGLTPKMQLRYHRLNGGAGQRLMIEWTKLHASSNSKVVLPIIDGHGRSAGNEIVVEIVSVPEPKTSR